MDLGLEGDSALVTASSRGLGFASATALAREGANVAICGTSPENVEEAAADLEETGDGDVLARAVDITSRAEVEALVEETVEAFDGLDHVVTSAGGVPSGTFLGTPEEDWYGAFDMLVMSHVWTLTAAHEHLAADEGGTVTAITSTSVREAIPNLVLSNAVRRAVIGSIKTISREWAPEVRANAVLPGPHETGRIQDLIEQAIERGDYDDYEAGRANWADPVPLDRIGDPIELGDTVAFLASDRASFVNGVALPVDGGRLRS